LQAGAVDGHGFRYCLEAVGHASHARPTGRKLAVSTSPTRPGFSGRKRWSTHVVQL
jgi:hypothetical protein